MVSCKFFNFRKLYMSYQNSPKHLPPLIAFIGCDGSGKSTLSLEITSALSKIRPTQRCYLGQGSGNIGRRIREIKYIGPILDRVIEKKATTARKKGNKIPGVLTALVIFLFSCIRYYNFKNMTKARQNGVLVVTDRYPQTTIYGFYDGPGLSAAHTTNWFISKLVQWEYKLYDRMASVKPDIIFRLNIDVDTAFARKQDHDYELLKAKVEVTPKLSFRGAYIVDVDATLPYEEVYQIVWNMIKDII
ncbi:Thymidylate kinase (Tmk) (PDB:3LV8) [Commensalibacter communis]|nr:Thymidylate kinase (Tmk) (PDB:3LV8) [Commensalibacter communis]